MIFYLCHCSLPVSGVSPCCFASFSKYLKLPQRIDSKNLQLVLVGKLCCEQGHLPPEQPLIQPDLEQLFPSNLLMAFHRQKQLEDILVLAKQFHETTEPVSDWLAVTEKKLANSEPIGTQTAKIQQQISRHKVGAGRRWLEPAPAPAVVSTTTRGVFGTNKDWRRFEKAANPDPLNIKLVSLRLPADLERKKKKFPIHVFLFNSHSVYPLRGGFCVSSIFQLRSSSHSRFTLRSFYFPHSPLIFFFFFPIFCCPFYPPPFRLSRKR